jgi:serine/threonine protein kinase
MTVAAGSRLGPYEIVTLLGAGGMGEVYRARDTRLGRDVAVKVLPAQFASDPGRLRRFEQEARAVAALDHPNILAIHDIGTHEGSPFIVSELLEGETLRERLRSGGLTIRKAVETAVQIAQGLAAAHEKGIVHRDLKPANVFVTKDGHVKLLDFGIAKLTRPDPGPQATTLTPEPSTETGGVLGTVGYMSPEQVRGLPADHRTDIFSFGCVLYEMLSGRSPFRKDTAAETMTAILHEDPPDLVRPELGISAALERVVKRCLEKEPSQRFEAAHDVVLALEVASAAAGPSAVTAAVAPARPRRKIALVALASVFLAASYAGVFLLTKQAVKTSVPSFKRITLRRGNVNSAYFTPDFQSVVYSASWEGKPSEVFVQRLASADARPLGGTGADVKGTAGGDVMLLRSDGSLARMPLEGGTPRELLAGIEEAALERGGTRFAIVRFANDRLRLEYPAGRILFECNPRVEQIDTLAVSPDGARVAFHLHKVSGPTDLCVVDTSGAKRTLSPGWAYLEEGVAWAPDGREVWFSAVPPGALRLELHAVTMSGKERLVARLPGTIDVCDIAPDGRVLVAFAQTDRKEMRGRMAGDAAERDLSWLDGTIGPVLAPDGTQMLFRELGEGGGLQSSTYHWRMGGPPPTRLGDGIPWDVSPDWKTALVLVGVGEEERELKLVPIGAGETRTLPRGPIRAYGSGAWHPDGKRIVLAARDAAATWRLFVQEVAGGLPRPIAEAWLGPFSGDGRFVATRLKNDERFSLVPIEGGEARPLPFLRAGDHPLQFADDGTSLFVRNGDMIPVHVVRLNLTTGAREPWLELAPPDRAGIGAEFGMRITPNGRFYAYRYNRTLSDLFLIEGLK